jgi:hypothetical protein
MNTNISTSSTKKVTEKKPNEIGGFHFSSGIKIFDPVTKEVLLQKRGDN